MPKAILELEMPESCRKCKLNKWDVWEHHRYVSINVLVCAVLGEECSDEGRRPDCPLKLADEHCRNAEWVNGKCRGHRISPYTYEILVQCKNCKDFEEYKGVEQE